MNRRRSEWIFEGNCAHSHLSNGSHFRARRGEIGIRFLLYDVKGKSLPER